MLHLNSPSCATFYSLSFIDISNYIYICIYIYTLLLQVLEVTCFLQKLFIFVLQLHVRLLKGQGRDRDVTGQKFSNSSIMLNCISIVLYHSISYIEMREYNGVVTMDYILCITNYMLHTMYYILLLLYHI